MFVKEGGVIVSYTKLAILGIVIFSLVSIAYQGSAVFAETVSKSTSFEKTTLIEYTNNEDVPIKSVRMWLSKDAGDFKSFKTEKGWTGIKTEQGLLIFTSDEPLAPGQSVKFGIKTEIASPSVNWRTLDAGGNELTIGRTEATKQSTQPPTQQPTQQPDNTQKPPATNFDNAAFRIIPESPKTGDSIRVMGEGFPPNTQLDFYIDSDRLEGLTTDSSGNVVGRTKIPLSKEAGRVEFSLSDSQGHKKSISLRIESKEASELPAGESRLTITQISEIVSPGDTARVSGTGKPGTTIAISYKDATGVKIQEAAVSVDAQGNWSYERIIPPDAELGTRVVEFTDGTHKITKTLSVSILKSIHITSSAIRYEPGETLFVNGTAALDQPVEIVIKDPIGKEIFFDVLKMNGTGTINFEFPTSQTSLQGTYVILMTQGDDTAILRVGLGELPSEQIVAKFGKLNHSTTEKAELTIQGPAKAVVSILVIDPGDKAIITDSITLGAEGTKVYEIDLAGFKSGVYTVVLKHLKSQIEEVFAVGLQHGSGAITMQSTKQTYALGDPVLILGTTNPNVLLTLQMIDPDGDIIKRKEVFTDKEGKFSDGTFRIPIDAKQGTWIIKATSGPNLAETPLKVVGTISQAFVVSVDKAVAYRSGDTMTISGTNAGKTQSAIITIQDSTDKEIQELTVFTTETGSFQSIWIVPTGSTPGNYKIKAKVGNEIAETTFKIQ